MACYWHGDIVEQLRRAPDERSGGQTLCWSCGRIRLDWRAMSRMSAPSIRPVSGFRTRPGTLADLDALLDLENRSFTTDRISRRSLRHFVGSRHANLVVAEADHKLAGYALVLFPPRSTIARRFSIAVAPHMAGRGLGPLLMEAVEQAAMRRGCRAVRLEVQDHNTRAIARYEKSGYRLFGRYHDYYDDRGDALRFEKPLSGRGSAP